ncbi:stage III sporulation protein AB [Selenomonadales bacterium OttesenSCG-928-I06]|nr:stage III sporulation protein AB [Selenomonadales bacterium OttesenSCG-928-I06]
MFLKIAGSLLILIAGTCLGFKLASNFSERLRQIRQLLSCFVALKSQISYMSCPINEALFNCTNGLDGPVADLFRKTSGILTEKSWLTPQEALILAFKEKQENLVLLKTEVEILEILFANLGASDRQDQEKALEMAEFQLIQVQKDAELSSSKNIKMYRYLGVCVSLAIIILLI